MMIPVTIGTKLLGGETRVTSEMEGTCWIEARSIKLENLSDATV
jgi:hypothetical protein